MATSSTIKRRYLSGDKEWKYINGYYHEIDDGVEHIRAICLGKIINKPINIGDTIQISFDGGQTKETLSLTKASSSSGNFMNIISDDSFSIDLQNSYYCGNDFEIEEYGNA